MEITTSGNSGETTQTTRERLRKHLRTEKFDIICILSGTNDLAYTNTVDEVSSRLDKMYMESFDQGARLVCVTIPQSAYKDRAYVHLRSGINERIRQFCLENVAKAALVDLELKLPYFDNNNVRDVKYWDDNLHLNPAGYDRFADLIFESLREKNFF